MPQENQFDSAPQISEQSGTDPMPIEASKRDYSLVGLDTKLAEERGLADAQWYACAIPRARLKELLTFYGQARLAPKA